jgi:hypothetical protein
MMNKMCLKLVQAINRKKLKDNRESWQSDCTDVFPLLYFKTIHKANGKRVPGTLNWGQCHFCIRRLFSHRSNHKLECSGGCLTSVVKCGIFITVNKLLLLP